MLVISEQQVEVFWEKQVAPSRSKIIAVLRQKLPNETESFSEDALVQFCNRGISKANRHDLHTEYNVYRFLAASLFFGEDFDQNTARPWSKEILEDDHVQEEHKGKLLELRIALETGRRI